MIVLKKIFLLKIQLKSNEVFVNWILGNVLSIKPINVIALLIKYKVNDSQIFEDVFICFGNVFQADLNEFALI
jgi:hypothetical protein